MGGVCRQKTSKPSITERAMDVIHRQLAASLADGLIAEVPCNDCSMVHPMDLAAGAARVERTDDVGPTGAGLALLDSHGIPLTSVQVLVRDTHSRHAQPSRIRPDTRIIEFHLGAKRRGRGNRRRRPSLDEGMAISMRLEELSAGRLYVDHHNLPCPRPLCVGCRDPLPLRTILIRGVRCWDCGEPTKIALGTIDAKILYPDEYTPQEREFAIEQGRVKLSVRSSGAFGDQYLANVCAECDSVQGDWTLDIDIHHRGSISETDTRSEFGPCHCAGNGKWEGKPPFHAMPEA